MITTRTEKSPPFLITKDDSDGYRVIRDHIWWARFTFVLFVFFCSVITCKLRAAAAFKI